MRRWNGVAVAGCFILAVAGCKDGGGRDRVISGAVSGPVAEGVRMTLVTPEASVSYATYTTAGGRYEFTRVADGTYEVFPTLPGYAFQPTSLRVTVAGGDVAGNDFTAFALPGTIDARFGSAGRVATPFGSVSGFAAPAALQRDGKIVLAGTSFAGDPAFAVARYDADGRLDPGFGAGGEVTTSIGSNAVANAVALQPDGKIVVAGSSSESGFTLARYEADGRLDPGFGSGGIVATAAVASGVARAIALQPDGKIVVAGSAPDGADDAFALARYAADGRLDASFGSGGLVTTAALGASAWAFAVAVQADGRIVAAGRALTSTAADGRGLFALARYATDGTLDPSFGEGGVVTTAASDWDEARALAIDAGGKIVIAGYSQFSYGVTFALARYGADGTLDAAFGEGGLVSTSFGRFEDVAHALALQPDGKILAAGSSSVISSQRTSSLDYLQFALARYRPDGTLDASFGAGGQVTARIGVASDQHDEAFAVGLQPDGKIVMAGSASSTDGSTPNGFALARFWP